MCMLRFELGQQIKNIFLVAKRLAESDNPGANRETCHDTELFQNLHLSWNSDIFTYIMICAMALRICTFIGGMLT